MHARQVTPSPNAATHAEGNLIQLHDRDLGWFAQVHPLLPAAIAHLVPGSSAGLSIAGAAIAALLLAALVERLYYQGFSRILIFFLVASLAAGAGVLLRGHGRHHRTSHVVPVGARIDRILGLCRRRQTYDGFVAGLAMGVGVICNFAFVVFAILISMAGPFTGHDRVQRNPRAVVGSATVLMFPTAAAVAGWAFIVWRYTGNPLRLAESSHLFQVGLGFISATRYGSWHRPSARAHCSFSPGGPRALLGVVLVPVVAVSWWIGLTISLLIVPLILTMVGVVSFPKTEWKATLVFIGIAWAAQIYLDFAVDPSHGVVTNGSTSCGIEVELGSTHDPGSGLLSLPRSGGRR
jgi:hypothetical protein